MSRFRVQNTAQVDREVMVILDWLEPKSITGACRWLEAFEAMQVRLADDPLSFDLADEAESYDEPLRQLSFGT